MTTHARGWFVLLLTSTLSIFSAEPGSLALNRIPSAHYEFEGPVGERIRANINEWLLPAPHANPGLLEMFRVRDRQPVPHLVPWAGEFVGKYLISAVQNLQLTEDPALRRMVREVVAQLVATQAEDGYLGPFRKAERLLKHWDLWGHYHCILGLLMWHEESGDPAALKCARQAADLVCKTYLDTDRSVLKAGSDEMNLAIIHGLGRLYRLTHEERYLRMMKEIEKDWESAGDYFRVGLKGVEFFEGPRPRWESLHDLQGLGELYLITGDTRYRQSYEHHWRSIARWDLRNTGGFSSGEQATGNPYAATAIETCCSIAWMAISKDILSLNGDPRAADALELATLNAWAGAQHPSGRWCTYSTPMDGFREASAHAIVFQSRPGTPELNCCSVNGPRGWGMLAEWALMENAEGIVINWLGPFRGKATLKDKRELSVRVSGEYPAGLQSRISIQPQKSGEFTVAIRVPAWANAPKAKVNGQAVQNVNPGSYLRMKRRWQQGDVIDLDLESAPRVIAGANEAAGKVSIYHGPVLLAWDQAWNGSDDLPALDLERLPKMLNASRPVAVTGLRENLRPWLTVEVPGEGASMRLCDFASAGATGTRYQTWLPAKHAPPAPILTRVPRDGATLAPGKRLFRWKAPTESADAYRLEIAGDAQFKKIIKREAVNGREALVQMSDPLQPGETYYWRVVAADREAGATLPFVPVPQFIIGKDLQRVDEALPVARKTGAQGAWVIAPLVENPVPSFGEWQRSNGWRKDDQGIALNGVDQKLIYPLGEWPEEGFTVALRVKIDAWPNGRLGQIFSAWAAPGDDPLRLVIDRGRLFARVEGGGGGGSTEGIPVQPGSWFHLTAVKGDSQLTLYIDGKKVASTSLPAFTTTIAKDFALGGNPHYSGNEHLAMHVKDLYFFGHPLSAGLIAELAKAR